MADKELDEATAVAALQAAGLITGLSDDTSPALSGDLDADSNDIDSVGTVDATQVTGGILQVSSTSNACSIDVSASMSHQVNLTENTTITVSGESADVYIPTFVKLVQDATGGRTVAWSGVSSWSGGNPPVVDTAANAETILSLVGYSSSVLGIAAAPARQALGSESTTARTVSDTDNNAVVVCDNASQVTITIPTNASDALDVGVSATYFASGGAGLTLSTAGITLSGSPNTTIAQGEAITLIKTATDTWLVIGGTAA